MFCLTPKFLQKCCNNDIAAPGTKRYDGWLDCCLYHAVFLRQHLRLIWTCATTTLTPLQMESISLAVNEVNNSQQVAKSMKAAYERGEDIPLTDVVMSIQKSSLSFEATLQVRNKVLKAYEEIMNMPV